jgi:hypothetical protein
MLAALALLQVEGAAPAAALPDDPGLARRLLEEPPSPAETLPLFRVALAFGYSSPLYDPDLNEGVGGGLVLALGRRLAAELRMSGAYQRYVDPFDNLGLQFYSGDITLGAGYAALAHGDLRLDLFTGVGPAWMTGVYGVTWSLGTLFGGAIEWRIADWVGLRLETSYHLFNLVDLGGAEFFDRRSLRKIGPVDRLDVPLGFVFRI